MWTNNVIKYLLVIAVAMPLLFSACNENNEKENQQTEEATASESKLSDATSKSVQSNNSRFSDIKVFKEVESTTKSHIMSLLSHYHALKNALVNEKPAEAKSISQEIVKEFESFDVTTLTADQQSFYGDHAEKLKQEAGNISATTKIDEQRESLPEMTNSLYILAKAYEANEEPLYYQYCPMAFDNAGGYWLSDSKEIENPYFGDKMLKCGATRETLTANN